MINTLSHRAYELQEPCSTFYTPPNKNSLISRLDKLTKDVTFELKKQGFEDKRIHVERMLNMRFEGTDTALMVLPNDNDGDGKEDFEAAFNRSYKTEFGFLLDTKSIIVDDIKVCTIKHHGIQIQYVAILPGSWYWEDVRLSRGIGVCRNRKVDKETR